MRYLNENLIRDSFLRLRQNKRGGKIGLERTSALVCFLAFDALLKRTSITPPLDFNPEVNNGNNNRSRLTREFTRLVQLKNGSEPHYLINLGEVTPGGNPPEKRFSSNFLTVSLKKATTSEKIYGYPNRPPNPLLILGPKATGLTWGIDRHPDWKENLPVFLQGRQTKTPFHDLACFILRKHGFVSEATMLHEGLADGLAEILTPELTAFWKTKLSLERIYAAEVEEPFQAAMPNPFENCSWMGDIKPVNEMAILSSRINYLEGLLRLHGIPFDN